MSRLLDLARGLPGHPSHPPFTDAAIGALTAGSLMLVLGWLGVAEETMVRGAFVVLLIGIAAAVGAAVTGLLDFVLITRGTPLWRTALSHMIAMLAATLLFALTAWLLWSGWDSGELPTAAAVTGVVAVLVLTLGGWIGGSIVFVHGMRVQGDADRPTSDALSPTPD